MELNLPQFSSQKIFLENKENAFPNRILVPSRDKASKKVVNNNSSAGFLNEAGVLYFLKIYDKLEIMGANAPLLSRLCFAQKCFF